MDVSWDMWKINSVSLFTEKSYKSQLLYGLLTINIIKSNVVG